MIKKEINKNICEEENYINLIKKYPKETVNFIMYDIYKYIYNDTSNKKNRCQLTFRNKLKDRYKKCIITNTGDKCCDACHIIPFNESSPQEQYEVNNGLLLRTDLHKLFDAGDIKINPETLCVELSENILSDNDYKKYHKYDNKKLKINKNSIYYLKKIYNKNIN